MASRPEETIVPEHAEMFWRGWHDLRFDRQYTFGGQTPISFMAIDIYAKRYGIRGAEFDIFKAIITEMDNEYLAFVERAEQEAARKREAATQNSGVHTH